MKIPLILINSQDKILASVNSVAKLPPVQEGDQFSPRCPWEALWGHLPLHQLLLEMFFVEQL